MSNDESKKMTPPIRTFAGDMEMAKRRQGLSSDKKSDSVDDAKIKEKEVIKFTKREKLEKQKAASGLKEVERRENDDTPDKEIVKEKIHYPEQPKKEGLVKIVAPKPNIKTKVVKTESVSGGTVITDTKSNRFKLIPAALASIKAWFKKITTPKKKQVPKYTIPETRRRKGVIQSATSKTGSIFSADSKTIKEQIRRRRLAEKQKETEEKDEPETVWSPYTDVGYNLIEAPETESVKNVKVEFKQQRPLAEPTQKKEEEPKVPEPTPQPKVVEEKPLVSEPVLEEVTEEPVPDFDEYLPDQDIEEGIAIPRSSENLDTNTLTVIVLASIISLVAVIFVGKMTFDHFFTGEQKTETMPAEAIMKNSTLKTITLTSDNVSALANLIKNREASTDTSFVEYAVVSQSGTEIIPSYLMNLFDFKTIPALENSITHIRFLNFSSSKNIILLKFIDETTVRGALLYWEPNMAEDLLAVLNLAPLGSEFRDDTIAGVPVRIIENEYGTGLIYGIVNANTALITTNETDFSQIVNQEFSN